MEHSRRQLLKSSLALAAAGAGAAGATGAAQAQEGGGGERTYRRIATEEAFATPEIYDAWRDVMTAQPGEDNYSQLHWTGSREHPLYGTTMDIGEGRIADMDRFGIDFMVLSLTAPGVQLFTDAVLARELAADCNDKLAAACQAHPDRFAGLAAVAPQDPQGAADEIQRAKEQLGLKGVIVNSHTLGEHLDLPKYRPILQAASDHDMPIYIHPRQVPKDMANRFYAYGLNSAMLGFAVETQLHAMRLLMSGAFDRFPNLKVVLGHLGEGIPYWMYRFDYMYSGFSQMPGYRERMRQLEQKPSETFKERFWVTTSGMGWEPAVMFNIEVMGIDKVMYAADYPYQTVPETIEVLDNLPISDEDKKKLYEDNAVELFKLG